MISVLKGTEDCFQVGFVHGSTRVGEDGSNNCFHFNSDHVELIFLWSLFVIPTERIKELNANAVVLLISGYWRPEGGFDWAQRFNVRSAIYYLVGLFCCRRVSSGIFLTTCQSFLSQRSHVKIAPWLIIGVTSSLWNFEDPAYRHSKKFS
jgi:hypothetical protein